MKSGRSKVRGTLWRLPLILALAVALVPVMPDLACGEAVGSIAGRVTAEGAPWGGAYVIAQYLVDDADGARWERGGGTYAGTDGSYEIGSLAPGTYRVGFFDWATGLFADEYWAGAPDIDSAQDVLVQGGVRTGGIDADLGGLASISGVVSGEDGPVSEISVVGFIRVEDTDGVRWDLVGWANTDASGAYRMQGLRAGTYRVGFHDWRSVNEYISEFWADAASVSDATDVEVATGGSAVGIDAHLEKGGEIVGVVNASEFEGGVITVDAYLGGGRGVWTLVQRTESGPGGSYHLRGLRTGTYRVAFSDRHRGAFVSQYWNRSATLEGAVDVGVVVGSVREGVDATLSRVGSPVSLAISGMAGADRYATALEISRHTYGSGSRDAVVLATGRNYPDALSAAALAGAADAPILLVDGKAASVSDPVRLEIERLTAGRPSVTVYIMGGTNAVSRGVEDSLVRGLPGARMVRVAGATRYDTAVEAARRVRAITGQPLERAFIVSGRDHADALLAGPVAFAKRWPVLLHDGTAAGDRRIMDVADEVRVVSAFVVGTEAAVPAGSVAALDDHFAGDVERIADAAEPYARSVQVAEWSVREGYASWSTVGIASGERFPDALVAAPCVGRCGAPLLLTRPTTLEQATAGALAANKSSVTAIKYFGGPLAVSHDVRSQIEALLR